MDNNQRKENYQLLRSIGFTKEEANRLKGGSPDRIREMVTQKERIVESVRQEITRKQQESSGLRYQSREQVQERRRDNYEALRKAGYSPAEANKLKGAQGVKVQYLIDRKQGKSEASIRQDIKKELVKAGVKPEKARQLSNVPVDKLQRIIIQAKTPDKISSRYIPEIKAPRGIQYQPVSEADKNYLSNYTYKISYMVKYSDGSKEEKWITITNTRRMSKKDVKATARDILSEDSGVEAYAEEDGVILVSTIQIDSAYYKDSLAS